MKLIALAVVLAVWGNWCGGGSTEVKSYMVATDAEGKPWLVNASVYRADTDKHTVLSWSEGSQLGPSLWRDCAVRDALNWRCELDKAEGTQMIDGRFSYYGSTFPDKNKYLTEPEWEALKATGKVTTTPAMSK